MTEKHEKPEKLLPLEGVQVRARVRPVRALRLGKEPVIEVEEDLFSEVGEPQEAVPDDFKERLAQIRRLNPDSAWSFIFSSFAHLRRKGLSHDQIACEFGVTLRQVYRWQEKYRDTLREEAKNFDPIPHLAESLSHYKAVQQAAWQDRERVSNRGSDRARFLEIANTAENDKHKFLKLTGVYDVVRWPLARTATDVSDETTAANDFVTQLRSIISGARELAYDSSELPENCEEDGGESL